MLDVVTEIQREQDATLVLSLRLPRRHVRLLRHGGERPPALDLPHARRRGRRRQRRAAARAAAQLAVVKDLAVDMTRFFDKWRDAKGYFEPRRRAARDDFAVVPPASAAAPSGRRRHRVHRLRRLLFRLRRRGLGPGLSRPRRAQPRVDARQRRARRRQRRAARRGRRRRRLPCLPHPYELHEFCPKAIAPTYAIAGLKRAMVAARAGRRAR